MHTPKLNFSESEKAEIIRKINEGLSVNKACEINGVDHKTIQNWQSQFPGGQISVLERIRILDIQVSQLTQTISELKKSKTTYPK